jgi:pilus assembly protein Flp/PilA
MQIQVAEHAAAIRHDDANDVAIILQHPDGLVDVPQHVVPVPPAKEEILPQMGIRPVGKGLFIARVGSAKSNQGKWPHSTGSKIYLLSGRGDLVLSIQLAVHTFTQAPRSPTMKKIANAVKRFVKNEDGPTAVEYAVMLALIIVLCIVVIRQVGTSASQTFSVTASALS